MAVRNFKSGLMNLYTGSGCKVTQKKRIMIVEDEAIFAMSLEMAFRRWGYEVFEPVAKGEDAVPLVEESRPDLVLMDIWLPGTIDGI